MRSLILMLAPVAPHLAEELWERLVAAVRSGELDATADPCCPDCPPDCC